MLELSDSAVYPTPVMGKVVRVKRNKVIEGVVTGRVVPTAMTFGPAGCMCLIWERRLPRVDRSCGSM